MRIKKKMLKLGTGSDELNSRDLPANYSPEHYDESQIASEGTDKISAHLKGISNRFGLTTSKEIVRAATTGNITLSGDPGSIDGYTISNGDRVLVKDQTTQSENGVYIVNTSGAWSRAPDMDSWDEIVGSMFIIASGTTYRETGWYNTNPPGGILGSTSISFASFTETDPSGSTGDIAETSFSAADNVSSSTAVTGFAFANGTVRSFKAIVSISRGSTYEVVEIRGIQRSSDWAISIFETGDDTGIDFNINTAGQIRYTSTSTGSGATLKFRAWVTGV